MWAYPSFLTEKNVVGRKQNSGKMYPQLPHDMKVKHQIKSAYKYKITNKNKGTNWKIIKSKWKLQRHKLFGTEQGVNTDGEILKEEWEEEITSLLKNLPSLQRRRGKRPSYNVTSQISKSWLTYTLNNNIQHTCPLSLSMHSSK